MKKILIIVDPQNDFVTGSLAVPDCMNAVNKMLDLSRMKFDSIVLSLDWHPMNHDSFDVHNGPWPVHCVEGTDGAKPYYPDFEWNSNIIIHKGMNPEIDSYSALRENDGITLTGLSYFLNGYPGDTEVYVCGLALDYCVKATAIDIVDMTGLKTFVVSDATKALGNDKETLKKLEEYNVTSIHSKDIWG